jgi:hypothetical protein
VFAYTRRETLCPSPCPDVPATRRSASPLPPGCGEECGSFTDTTYEYFPPGFTIPPVSTFRGKPLSLGFASGPSLFWLLGKSKLY